MHTNIQVSGLETSRWLASRRAALDCNMIVLASCSNGLRVTTILFPV